MNIILIIGIIFLIIGVYFLIINFRQDDDDSEESNPTTPPPSTPGGSSGSQNQNSLDALLQSDRNEIMSCSSTFDIRDGVGLDRIGLGISYNEVEDKIYFNLPLSFRQPVRIENDFNFRLIDAPDLSS